MYVKGGGVGGGKKCFFDKTVRQLYLLPQVGDYFVRNVFEMFF